MGGYGSGRPSYKQKAEHCRALNVNCFHREGCLRPGLSGSWQWKRYDEEVARINWKATDAHLILDYRVRVSGGDWESINQPVPITYVDCNYGNQRPYFLCPGVVNGRHCGQRVVKLYAGGRYFLCRHCYNIAYGSQSEAKYDRALRRANKIRMALGGEPGTASWIAFKPKGMWLRTYQRKRRAIETAEHQANILFLSKHRAYLSRDELEIFFGESATVE